LDCARSRAIAAGKVKFPEPTTSMRGLTDLVYNKAASVSAGEDGCCGFVGICVVPT
jgi:hypothetical protein